VTGVQTCALPILSVVVTGFGCRPRSVSSSHAPRPVGRRSKAAMAIQTAAPSFRVELTPVGVHDAAEVERGITEFAQGSDGGLIVVGPPSSIRFHRDLIIVGLATRHRLHAIYASLGGEACRPSCAGTDQV